MIADQLDLISGAVLACCVAGAIALSRLLVLTQRGQQLAARVRSVSGGDRASVSAVSDTVVRVLRFIGHYAQQSSIIFGSTHVNVTSNLAAAGYRSETALRVFLGIKLLSVLVCSAMGLIVLNVLDMQAMSYPVPGFGSILLGLLVPDRILLYLRKRYVAQLERGLGDALDLLVICAEAGLPLESGIEHVAAEFRSSNRATALEFQVIAHEMKILSDRRQALLNAGIRTGVDDIAKLGATLAQSIRYGTPLAQALRTLAMESRAATLNRFEARAARLPVMLTVPMILFILPCLFIVVGTPAVLQVLDGVAGR